ncbi:hypothetical protein DIPPA_21725 [Diplonema papillatum]|nr:hypothetical protein DIPPA_21725 [Diplonema papillatum]
MLADHENVVFPNPQEVWVRPPPPRPTLADMQTAHVAAVLARSNGLVASNGDSFHVRDFEERF